MQKSRLHTLAGLFLIAMIAALQLSDAQLSRTAHAARERVLAEHTGAQRAQQFEEIIEKIHGLEMAAA